MKEKEYIDTLNKMKASEELKKKTIQKMEQISKQEKPEKEYKMVGKQKRRLSFIIAHATFLFVVAIGLTYIAVQLKESEDIGIIDYAKSNSETLETLDTFENLQKLAKSLGGDTTDLRNSTKEGFAQDVKEENAFTEQVDEYSKTNIQVEGVDESDIVKTDGNYIYYISGNTKLVIVDITNKDKLEKIKEIEYSGTFMLSDLYIYNDKLVVIGTEYKVGHQDSTSKRIGYANETIDTKAIVYNVKDKQDIKIEREVTTQGNYISSRMIKGNLYFITRKSIYSSEILDKEADGRNFMPVYKDSMVSNEEQYISYDRIYCLPNPNDTTYTMITSFHVEEGEKANVETFLGSGGSIYCSNDNLYIIGNVYSNINPLARGEIATLDIAYYNTIIYKFHLRDSNVSFVAKTEVEGSVLNQFSMDEYKGYFRIAVTKGYTTNERDNNIYVFDQNLNQVGKIEGLAKQERIYSVRFMKEKCYMVTYKEVDPLFVIDLSDPTLPKVLGELKIPGYSTYLHPYDENHIIGFGNDTKIQTDRYGQREVITGMKMALFDVSDVNHPKELFCVKIGGQGTYSELLYNHKSLLFSKEKNIIAFPITISNDKEVTTKTNLAFQGAIIYSLDLQNGFIEKAKISHSDQQDQYGSYDYNLAIDRILYIQDRLITTSKGLIKLTNMNTLEEIDRLKIETKDQYLYLE